MADDSEEKFSHGMGWIPGLPDFRDYTLDYDEVPPRKKELGQKDSIKAMVKKLIEKKGLKAPLPGPVDLRANFSPIENQDPLNSCTAHAGVGIVEYFEKRAFNKYIDASRLFLYKATRNLLGWTGDRGAYMRTTMGALTLFGTPPEKYWPYNPPDFDVEPSAFLYAYAQNYQAISYLRLDPTGTTSAELLEKVKLNLGWGVPPMFGFVVFSSIGQARNNLGKIPYPAGNYESVLGGHAVVACGYNDDMVIKNTNPGGKPTKGALLIRNSWGTTWGDKGYGWLPYEYIKNGLAWDFWTLLKNEWVDTGKFGFPGP